MPELPLITDAAPSPAQDLARRRRTYTILMVVHLVGFAASYPLYLWRPWAGAVMVGVTGLLPWAAVLLANASPRRRDLRRRRAPQRRALPRSPG